MKKTFILAAALFCAMGVMAQSGVRPSVPSRARPQAPQAKSDSRTDEATRGQNERSRVAHAICHQDLKPFHRRVVEIQDEGWGVWDTRSESWLLEPQFQQIYVPDGTTAIIQLKPSGKWRIQPLGEPKAAIALAQSEFDEARFIDTFPMAALNRRDSKGGSHWRLWVEGGWSEDPAVSYSDLRLYSNAATGGYDLLTRTQRGTWSLLVAGRGRLTNLASAERLPDMGAYLISKTEGKHRLYGIVSSTLSAMLPTEYDRIEPRDGAYIITRSGKSGIALAQSDGTRTTIAVAVPPQYDHASLQTLTLPALNHTYSYALVGTASGYAPYSLRFGLQMLPAIFTPDEVRDFQTRLLTATDPAAPDDQRRRARATLAADTTADYRRYAQAEAHHTCTLLAAGGLTPDEAARSLSDTALTARYLRLQADRYGAETSLGPYDRKSGTLTLATHWGPATLTLPRREASALRRAWKRHGRPDRLQYELTLGPDSRPVLRRLILHTRGHTYTWQ